MFFRDLAGEQPTALETVSYYIVILYTFCMPNKVISVSRRRQFEVPLPWRTNKLMHLYVYFVRLSRILHWLEIFLRVN